MSIEQIQIVIMCMPLIITVLFFLFVLVITRNYNPGKAIVRTYERVNNHLRENRNGFFNYDHINQFLTSNGAASHYGRWIDPVKYFILRLVAAATVFLVIIRFHWFLAAVGAIIGFKLPEILLIYLNKQDNNKMMIQIQTIYNALSVQIKAGVYVSDALMECYRSLPDGRLRKALEELSGELFLKNSFEEAIQSFNNKFSNSFIDSLCIILRQAQESGQAVELLRDMSEQIKDMQSALLLKKKEALDRSNTICILGVLTAAMIVILYAVVSSMFTTASQL